MIEFRNPVDEQKVLMQAFGDLIAAAIQHTMQHDGNRMNKVHEKLQEAMHWYQTGILSMDFNEKPTDDQPTVS